MAHLQLQGRERALWPVLALALTIKPDYALGAHTASPGRVADDVGNLIWRVSAAP